MPARFPLRRAMTGIVGSLPRRQTAGFRMKECLGIITVGISGESLCLSRRSLKSDTSNAAPRSITEERSGGVHVDRMPHVSCMALRKRGVCTVCCSLDCVVSG